MFPLLPFIAGVATGVFAVNALRRSDVQRGLRRARRVVREAADASVQRARSSSAKWHEYWSRTDDEADAPGTEDKEVVDATFDDKQGADAPRRRTRRGGHRRTRQEEPDNGLEAKDAASEAANDAAGSSGA